MHYTILFYNACAGVFLPPGTRMAMLLPLKSILPWCCMTFLLLVSSSGSISHSTASSSMTLTKSSKPTSVPSNSRFDCSTISTLWLIVLSMTSKGKISGRLIVRRSVCLCVCVCGLPCTCASSNHPFMRLRSLFVCFDQTKPEKRKKGPTSVTRSPTPTW